jgi:hypothetical protein
MDFRATGASQPANLKGRSHANPKGLRSERETAIMHHSNTTLGSLFTTPGSAGGTVDRIRYRKKKECPYPIRLRPCGCTTCRLLYSIAKQHTINLS